MSIATDKKKIYIYHSPYTSKGAGKLEMVLTHNAYLGEQNEKFHTNIERTVLSLLLSLSSYHFSLEFVRGNSWPPPTGKQY